MRAWFFLVLLVGCVTVPPVAYEFPLHFTALQVVEMKGREGNLTLLATLDRDGKHFTAVFLDAVLQRPLIRLEYDAHGFRETRLSDLAISSEDAQWIMGGIVKMFERRDFRAEGAALVGSADGVAYSLRDWEGPPACRRPRVIEWTLDRRGPLVIRVENREFECLPAKA